MPNEEYIYHIQLKNPNNELLYPITLWNLIQDKPLLQTQLTSANAGPGISIDTTTNSVIIKASPVLDLSFYGTKLPATGVEGQIFYKIEEEQVSNDD